MLYLVVCVYWWEVWGRLIGGLLKGIWTGTREDKGGIWWSSSLGYGVIVIGESFDRQFVYYVIIGRVCIGGGGMEGVNFCLGYMDRYGLELGRIRAAIGESLERYFILCNNWLWMYKWGIWVGQLMFCGFRNGYELEQSRILAIVGKVIIGHGVIVGWDFTRDNGSVVSYLVVWR